MAAESGSAPAAPRKRATALKPSRPRKPPRYPYDGLSGLWLRLPWWLHLVAAALAWPLCTEWLPRIPAREPTMAWLFHVAAPAAWPAAVALALITAALSWRKARTPAKKAKKRPAAARTPRRTKPAAAPPRQGEFS